MHSTIFSDGGPATQSVYAPARQHELFESVKGSLRQHNGRAPELDLPSAADIKCTQMAGCNAVIPGRQQAWQEPPTAGGRPGQHITSQQALVYEGEEHSVVRARDGDPDFMPKEFWQTSVNLQWHDTRNERCRSRLQGTERHGVAAQDAKRHEMSSEIFGTNRVKDASTANARGELLADTADHLAMDSTLLGRKDQSDHHRSRMHANLTNSNESTLARREPAQAPQRVMDEDPQGRDRRQKEKNFSDMFGTQMGDRKDVRGNREEILCANNTSFLDFRGEIASRNKEHWRQPEERTADARKREECSSRLFNFQAPARPSPSKRQEEEAREERACWDTTGSLTAGSEIARRQRTRDHCTREDEEAQAFSPQKAKQDRMASTQVTRQMQPGVQHNPERNVDPQGPTPRLLGGERWADASTPFQREQMLKSARETKLAFLQSSIF